MFCLKNQKENFRRQFNNKLFILYIRNSFFNIFNFNYI